jgi:hypothetical protein
MEEPMLTPELFKQAIDTADDTCTETECVHAKMMEANREHLLEVIQCFGVLALSRGLSPSLSLFALGLHVGYRLHQLEIEADNQAVDTTKVN